MHLWPASDVIVTVSCVEEAERLRSCNLVDL